MIHRGRGPAAGIDGKRLSVLQSECGEGYRRHCLRRNRFHPEVANRIFILHGVQTGLRPNMSNELIVGTVGICV
jgi:hypothetical protein